MLDAHELDAFFAEHFHLRAFRQEIGEDYAGANEQDTLTRYLNNEPAPRSLFENPFLDELGPTTKQANSGSGCMSSAGVRCLPTCVAPLSGAIRPTFK